MAQPNQSLIDLGSDSPKALSPAAMSNKLAGDIVNTIDLGNFELTRWQEDFIEDMLGRPTFSLPQKQVIYKLAFKLKLL